MIIWNPNIWKNDGHQKKTLSVIIALFFFHQKQKGDAKMSSSYRTTKKKCFYPFLNVLKKSPEKETQNYDSFFYPFLSNMKEENDPFKNPGLLTNWQYVKDHISLIVYDIERDLWDLHDIIHEIIPNINVALIPIVKYNSNSCCHVFYLKKEVLDLWQKTAENVIKISKISSLSEPFLSSLSDYVKSLEDHAVSSYVPQNLLDCMEGNMKDFSDDLYLLKNREALFGAVQIGNMEVLKRIHRITGDFLIIPSSVHELILVPKIKENYENLRSLVNFVNNSIVEEKDIFSYRIFSFDGNLHSVDL